MCSLMVACADKQVFPKVDVLGWYVTGAAVEDAHMHIHKRVRRGCWAHDVQGLLRSHHAAGVCFAWCPNVL